MVKRIFFMILLISIWLLVGCGQRQDGNMNPPVNVEQSADNLEQEPVGTSTENLKGDYFICKGPNEDSYLLDSMVRTEEKTGEVTIFRDGKQYSSLNTCE